MTAHMMERMTDMNNTDKKILFFDIDGTLLTPPPFSVPESTVIGLKKAQAQGHLTFVNTGRIYGIIPDNIKALGFDGYVCGCGSQIYLHDELLFLSVLPNKTCREIVQLLRDCRISAFSNILTDFLWTDLPPPVPRRWKASKN